MTPYKSLVVSLILVCLTACSTQTALIQSGQSTSSHSQMQHFFVSGLGQTQSVDTAAVCGGADKVAKVERSMSVLNGLLSMLSSGIYTPYEAKVYCTNT
jgi:hypothetical protein